MDGNPPDYIGEQFRFLEYLAVCGMKEPGVFKIKIQGFLQQYTIDTVHELCAAFIKSYLSFGNPKSRLFYVAMS